LIQLSSPSIFTTEQPSNETHLILPTTEISKHERRKFHEIFEYETQTELTTQTTVKFISTTSRKTFTKLFRKLTTRSTSTRATTTTNNIIINDNQSVLFRKKTLQIEEVSLNQAWTLLLFFLAALLFFTCILVSTLACVSFASSSSSFLHFNGLFQVRNRHTIKRKSRITEMEAHLDEHYLYYPQPLLFQQLH